ncbi:erythromycin esterase family protein [Empedobacter brevis]|uniref:erythromycin esterase family protein n=1 Tax=Empedobacter brevis TaxID=247 RepID=UPI0039AF9573
MKKIVLATLCVFINQINIYAQEDQYLINAYYNQLHTNSTILQNTIDHSIELDALGKHIADARIVLLGEPSHGDGGAIRYKTELVKYLYKNKNFDVLLFEADFYSIQKGIQESSNKNLKEQLEANIYTCWSTSPVSQELWDFYNQNRKSKRPLVIGGFDIRHAGNYAKNNLEKDLQELFTKIHFNLSHDYKNTFFTDLKYVLDNEFKIDRQKLKNEKGLYDVLNSLHEKLSFSELNSKDRTFWLIAIENLKGNLDVMIHNKNRDIAMAKTFLAIAKYMYPGKKIMVWSHNNHNVLDVHTYLNSDDKAAKDWYQNNTYESFSYFGAELYRELKNEIYSLAITSGKGNYSPYFFGTDYFHADLSKQAKIVPSGINSLEAFLETKTDDSPLFIPLPKAQGKPSGYPKFAARLLDLNYELKLDYTSAFNGIIYLPTTVDLKNN